MDFSASASRSNGARLPAALIERVCEVLNLQSTEESAPLIARLRVIAISYLDGKECEQEAAYGEPKVQRAALRKLQGSVERVLVDMKKIAPEYVVALDHDILLNPTGTDTVLLTARDDLEKLHQAITALDGRYNPRKGPAADIALEEAVRDLRFLIEELGGEPPRAKLNKHLDCHPELVSASARAIGTLLKGVDPTLTDTAIGDMIEKVHGQPTPSRHHFDELIGLDPDGDLDLSLLPGRRRD